MTATVDRRTAEELLPFLVNGTLEGDERRMVEAQLASDPQLAEQVEVLAKIRTQMQQEPDGVSPGEFGLARLMREIEAEAPVTAKPANSLHRPVFAALAAVVALVAVTIGALVMRNDATAPVYYEQASGDTSGAVLTIAFRPEATQARMTDLLLSNGLVIVDGPSALGLYRVQSIEGEDLSVLADRLAKETGLVETVDTLQ